VDLVLIKALDVLCNTCAIVEPGDNSRLVALKAVDYIRYYYSILLSLLRLAYSIVSRENRYTIPRDRDTIP
jgi:hypothetical protein